MSTSLQLVKYENSGFLDDWVQGAVDFDDMGNDLRKRRARGPCHPQRAPDVPCQTTNISKQLRGVTRRHVVTRVTPTRPCSTAISENAENRVGVVRCLLRENGFRDPSRLRVTRAAGGESDYTRSS